MTIKKKHFWDLWLVDATWEEWENELEEMCTNGKQLQIIMTPNPEQIELASRDDIFHEYLRRADWLIPDGVGLVGAARVKERLTGVDSAVKLLEIAQREKLKVLLIGGRYESENGKLKIENEEIQTEIYYTEGYQRWQKVAQSEEKALQLVIADTKPDIIMVALGAPGQEKWLVEHRELMENSGVRVAMAVGGTFDFLMGRVKRAPEVWQKMNLEWSYRLIQEPWRARRQLSLVSFWWHKRTGRWRQN